MAGIHCNLIGRLRVWSRIEYLMRTEAGINNTSTNICSSPSPAMHRLGTHQRTQTYAFICKHGALMVVVPLSVV